MNRPPRRNSEFWLGVINGCVLASVFWFIMWWAVFP
jgi:Mg/Co/Ni transporter MgtE